MLEKYPRRSHGFALVLGLSMHLKCSHFHVSFLTECENPLPTPGRTRNRHLTRRPNEPV